MLAVVILGESDRPMLPAANHPSPSPPPTWWWRPLRHKNTGWKRLTRQRAEAQVFSAGRDIVDTCSTAALQCSAVERSVFIFLISLQPLQSAVCLMWPPDTTVQVSRTLHSQSSPSTQPRPDLPPSPPECWVDRTKSHVISYNKK